MNQWTYTVYMNCMALLSYWWLNEITKSWEVRKVFEWAHRLCNSSSTSQQRHEWHESHCCSWSMACFLTFNPLFIHQSLSFTSAAAYRVWEWDDRTVGPPGQEGRLQNLLRWGELLHALLYPASQQLKWRHCKVKQLCLDSCYTDRK